VKKYPLCLAQVARVAQATLLDACATPNKKPPEGGLRVVPAEFRCHLAHVEFEVHPAGAGLACAAELLFLNLAAFCCGAANACLHLGGQFVGIGKAATLQQAFDFPCAFPCDFGGYRPGQGMAGQPDHERKAGPGLSPMVQNHM
jgi:hypothetical protein